MLKMAKLNCGVGDLAITVRCNFPESLGNIVRIISAEGFQEWQGHDKLLYTWNVDVATEDGYLYYQGEDGLEPYKSGPVPDSYLRRLTPPQGYLMTEFSDSEQLQMDFHQTEVLERDMIEEFAKGA
jgi:hypothetical protein